MKFAWMAGSRIGSRSYNEDRVLMLHSREAWLLVVADGMGGHLNGELAAQMVIDTLSHRFELGARPVLADPQAFLREGLAEIQGALERMALQRRFPEVPSATVAIALVQRGQLYAVWAGDARAYLLRDGAVLWRSRDHSTVQRLIDCGQLTPEEALAHPERNRVTSCLGGIDQPEVGEAGPLPLAGGDAVLVCSDGVWSQFGDAELARALTARPPQRVVPALLQVAERRAGERSDNLSAAALMPLPDDAAGAEVLDSALAPEVPDALGATLESEMLAAGGGL